MTDKPTKNPNVKTDWTAADLDLIGRQVDKYYQTLQTSPREAFGKTDHCLICDATSDGNQAGEHNCKICPLNIGIDRWWPCMFEKSYIDLDVRYRATKPQLRRRLKYLIAQLGVNGIDIVDEDM